MVTSPIFLQEKRCEKEKTHPVRSLFSRAYTLQILPAYELIAFTWVFLNVESIVFFRRVDSIEATQQLPDREPAGLILNFAREGLGFLVFCLRENVLVHRQSFTPKV